MSKYRAIKTEVDGIVFDSKKEASRYRQLRLLESGGEIENLEIQPKFDLVVNGTKVCTYKADFKYLSHDNGLVHIVIEDCKGFKTSVYRLKKKLMRAIHGIEVLET